MTEDEQAELLGFTGKTIDGKLYVEFEDFDRLRKWIRKVIMANRSVEAALRLTIDNGFRDLDFDERDMQGGQV